MKLLFDQNLSFRLVSEVADLFPDSLHVRDIGLHAALDEQVWNVAKQRGLTVVSKDAEFHQRSLLFGAPPKVIWISLGTCSTSTAVELLRNRRPEILAFERETDAAFLALR